MLFQAIVVVLAILILANVGVGVVNWLYPPCQSDIAEPMVSTSKPFVPAFPDVAVAPSKAISLLVPFASEYQSP